MCKIMRRNTLERREQIKDLILEKGLWSLNKKKLVRDFKVSYPTIYSDMRAILKKIPDDEIEEIGYELNLSFKEVLLIARRHLKSNNETVSIKSVSALTQTISQFTSFLESFGYKDKIPELLNTNVNMIQGEDSLKQTIRTLAEQKGLPIFDYFIELLPGEVSNTLILRRLVSSDDDSWIHGNDFQEYKAGLQLKSKLHTERTEMPVERKNSVNKEKCTSKKETSKKRAY